MGIQAQNSVWNAAVPYAVAAIAVGGAGAVIAFSSASTVAAVAGVVFAMMGAYGFFAVVTCAVTHWDDPQGFHRDIGKFILTGAATALTQIIQTVAQLVLIDLILNRRRI